MPLLSEEQVAKLEKALEENGCWWPGLCASFPYSCGCGFLVSQSGDTLETIRRLAEAPDFPCRDCG